MEIATSGIRQAVRLIFLDELTGLYNRRFIRQYLRERPEQLAQQQTPLCVIMLDLDGFKQVNDTYGHQAGDFVLQRLAQLIGEALTPSGYAVRFAGDEFLILLEGVDGGGGVRLAEAIRERVAAEPFRSEKIPTGLPVRISVGVAALPEDVGTVSDLIEAADRALYRSKRMGKDCVSRASGGALPPEVEVFAKGFPCPRLVGREAELGELERPLQDAADAKNRLLLVVGGRGVGKSRLLAELMQRALGRGFRCFFQRCLDSHQTIPYSNLSPILAACLAREPERLVTVQGQLAGPTVTELGTIIPDLGASEPASEPVASEDRRSRLFHGMGDLLCLLSQEAPLLLFLDDLHFMDEASLEVLYRLLDRQEGRVTVYSAADSEVFGQDAGALPLVRFLPLLRQSPNFLTLPLPHLALPEITQMVTAILDQHAAPSGFIQRLYEASGGIPLFVEETLKGLIAKRALRTSSGVWDLDAVEPNAVPESLAAAVLGGLEALDPETRAMISKAAVVGPHVDLALLTGVLGKDAGEILQLVERGKRFRVFEEPGPLADEEEVRFLSQCFREIVYSHLDHDSRRQTHRLVGEVAERLAGPRMEEMLGPLAYHFERSDDAAKAEFYRQRVGERQEQLFSAHEIARELSLKVGTMEPASPLDEPSVHLAVRFLRALTMAIKNMRMYPPGSHLVVDSVAAATALLRELLARLEAVTVAEEGQALQVNGHSVESTGLTSAARDLLRVYADHGIRWCTFERGTTEADMMGLVKALSGPLPGIHHDAEFWEERLQSEGVRHVRVFPVIYLAAEKGKTVWRREQSEARLDNSMLTLVRDVLRSISAVVDTIQLYPPGSRLITITLDQLERQTQVLFTRIPSLTVGIAEGMLVVNATRPNPRQFGITIGVVQRLMEDNGLTSLTIRRGVSRDELEAFFSQLAQPPEDESRGSGFWQSLLGGRGISRIEVGTRTYAPAAMLGEGETSSEEERTLRQVAQWLKEPLGTFLDLQIQREIPPVLAVLRRLEREDLARELVERTAGALAEPDGIVRRQAASGLYLSLTVVEDLSIDWLLALVLEPLREAARKETQLEPFQGEVEIIAWALKRLLLDGDLSGASHLAEALGGMPPEGPDADKFVEVLRALVDSLETTGALQRVLLAWKDTDPARRQQGSAVLVGLGAGAVPFLVRLILQGDDEEIRRAAALLLRAQGAGRLVTQNLRHTESVEETVRIVGVLDLVAPQLGGEFFFLLGHPEAEVQAEMARTLTRLTRDDAVRFLGRALGQPKPDVVLGALERVRGLRAVELLDSVSRLLANPLNEDVLRAACLCLGRLKDVRAVPPLLQVLARRPRFFGLVKGLPEGTRATAARALGELAFPEAREGLEAALRSRGKTVRSAARLALLQIQQELRANQGR